jgi:hypothetical protein
MEFFKCKWMPPIIKLSDFGGDWKSYDDYLYSIFYSDFFHTRVKFRDKTLRIREQPRVENKAQAYYHVTSVDTSNTNDEDNRIPDMRRCERVPWIRKFIDNHMCNEGCCSAPKIWAEDYKGNTRWHIMIEEVRFLVVVEERDRYCLLITAFYLEYDSQLRKRMEKYNKYKQKTPIS